MHRQGDHRHRRFRHVIHGAPLDGQRDDLVRLSLGVFAALLSTADTNLNVVSIAISKLVRGKDWKRFEDETADKFEGRRSAEETSILNTTRVTIKHNNKSLIQFIFQDITNKKKSELITEKFKEELEVEVEKRTKELNSALEKQQLFLDQIVKSSQIKTDFMATMSHELRTPLNAIIGFTDLLLERVYGELNEEQIDLYYNKMRRKDYYTINPK